MGVLEAGLRGAKEAGRRKRRTSLEIIADILSAAEEGEQNKTAIIRKANLNSCRAKKYFPLLLSRGLMLARDGPMGTTYATTKNGMRFLQVYKEVKEVERELSKRLKEIQGYLGATEAEENRA